jgi:glucose/arabinose dehydrogenase
VTQAHGRRVLRCVTVLVGVVVLAACSGDGEAPAAAPPTTVRPGSEAPSTVDDAPATTTTTDSAPVTSVRLQRVASLDEPVAMAPIPESDEVFIAERTGRLRRFRVGPERLVEIGRSPALDLTRRVQSSGTEQGLLGVAVSPDGRTVVVNFITGGGSGATVVERYDLDGGVIDPDSGTELLRVRQPFSNHNGGQVAFDRDGQLYVGLGDGGSQGDPDNRGQNPRDLLGKIVRIDPDGGRPEVWITGLRNPWRFSFDPADDTMWIGDVGGSEREEINRVSPGARPNLGWSLREGTVDTDRRGDRSGLVDPVYDYDHSQGGCSVIGGYVYRGSRIPGLVGTYVFGDYCVGEIWGLDAANPSQRRTLAEGAKPLSSFGVDSAGELYVLSLDGEVWRLEP